ncbi:MAG: RidA family protein [Actinobacteria bacterium]|nr:RidA family protein [Actinomycetota bacterium]
MTPDSPNRSAVTAADAPAAIGPYSQAIAYGGLLYCSGGLPIDPAADALVQGSAGAETEQCLRNLAAVCRGAGTELSRAVRVTVYTTRLEDFAEINEAYGAFFDDPPPARVAIGVAALPKGAAVEIDAVVALG